VFAQPAEPEYVEVQTSHGRLRGAKAGNLTTFKGIPYAGSVSGASRFQARQRRQFHHDQPDRPARPLAPISPNAG
jgi:carboxylesterase type B